MLWVIVIEITLEYVLKNMENVRPSAIFIGKDKTSLNVITTIMRNDIFCWKNKRIRDEQIVKAHGLQTQRS